MASLQKAYSEQKRLGKVYTPRPIVERIYAEMRLTASQLLDRSLLDPACGDGRFLVVLVERILVELPETEQPRALENLHGWDLDEEALAECRANLDALVADRPYTVQWKLRHTNALRAIGGAFSFDFVVGNPPYIRIQHLDATDRTFIQQHYTLCRKGAMDAYLAFIELADSLLTERGCCGFITPNSFLSSEAGEGLRGFWKQTKRLRCLLNFGAVQVFEKASTYAAITVFGKGAQAESFGYGLANEDQTFRMRAIRWHELPDKGPWRLSTEVIQPEAGGQRLGDICQISVGISTLCDAVYIIKKAEEGTDATDVALYRTRDQQLVRLEKDILRPIVKASKLKTADQEIEEWVIFPYELGEEGRHRILPEEQLRAAYPLAYHYLLSQKDQLDKRDNGKPNPVAWYAFGRSQALDSGFGSKIVFSPINKTPNFVLLTRPDCTVYSGYFIRFEGDYEWLLSVLHSDALASYITDTGRDFRGGWKGYNKKVLENFRIPPSLAER
jgi:methylase of polypeptide subunit release factors